MEPAEIFAKLVTTMATTGDSPMTLRNSQEFTSVLIAMAEANVDYKKSTVEELTAYYEKVTTGETI